MSDASPPGPPCAHFVGDTFLALEVTEVGEDGRLQQVEGGRVNGRSVEPLQEPLQYRLRRSRPLCQVEDGLGHPMRQRRVEVEQRRQTFEHRTVTGDRQAMRRGARAFERGQVVGEREEIGNAVLVEDAFREDDVGTEEDVAYDVPELSRGMARERNGFD